MLHSTARKVVYDILNVLCKCYMTSCIAVWKINIIHNIIVWMWYIACYIWFKSSALPSPLPPGGDSNPPHPPQCACAQICSKLKVYLLLIRQGKRLNTLQASSSSVAAPFDAQDECSRWTTVARDTCKSNDCQLLQSSKDTCKNKIKV